MGDDAKIPVWLDCDPGHDDAFAILLSAYHPAMNLLGISTVHGNASMPHTTWNATSILTAIGKPEIPVYAGAAKGLTRPAVHAEAIHGDSGLDGTSLLPEPLIPARSEPCIPAIASALLSTPPDTAWIVATGALTNIALLFQEYPDLATHIKGLSLMGGALGSSHTDAPMGTVEEKERIGNYTPYAEFNILVDPEAAHFLLSHEILRTKTTIIPLDVTHLVLATPDVLSLLSGQTRGEDDGKGRVKGKTQLRQMLLELLTFFAKTYADVFGITAGPPLHDPLAVAAILDGIAGVKIPFYDYTDASPERKERYQVDVITDGTHEEALAGKTETGRTVVRLLPEGEEGVKIPRGLDVARFWGVLEECLSSADAVNAAKANIGK